VDARAALGLLAGAVVAGCAPLSPGLGAPPPDGPDHLAVAHSHNDYERARPLLDALERGFASIEVDVALRGGELYVAHAVEEVRADVTLRAQYLDPLRALARRNGGRVHSGSAPLQLLIDVKTEAEATYRALDAALGDYGELFTTWTPDGVRWGPVTAVISGNRALSSMRADDVRYAAADGRVTDDRSAWSVEDMPLVSVDWEELGTPSPRSRLVEARRLIELLRREGRKVRFWGTLDDETLWRSLVDIGVDYLGTDDPARLERMLRAAR
jgi:glycerophosphoryl diester phosphodiesterase